MCFDVFSSPVELLLASFNTDSLVLFIFNIKLIPGQVPTTVCL